MRELTMENGRVKEPDALDPGAPDVLDLGDVGLTLECAHCPTRTVPGDGPGESVEEVKPDTVPVRKDSDPDTVVRCATCGRKHSKESLRA